MWDFHHKVAFSFHRLTSQLQWAVECPPSPSVQKHFAPFLSYSAHSGLKQQPNTQQNTVVCVHNAADTHLMTKRGKLHDQQQDNVIQLYREERAAIPKSACAYRDCLRMCISFSLPNLNRKLVTSHWCRVAVGTAAYSSQLTAQISKTSLFKVLKQKVVALEG